VPLGSLALASTGALKDRIYGLLGSQKLERMGSAFAAEIGFGCAGFFFGFVIFDFYFLVFIFDF
jgi:hypothetical protein